MERSIKRSILRKKYEKFSKAWENEKRYQQSLLQSGHELEEGHQQLGKKPTFAMWLVAVENKRLNVSGEVLGAEKTLDEKKVQVDDVEWK